MWGPAGSGGPGDGHCTGCLVLTLLWLREASFLAVSGVHRFVEKSRLQVMFFESPRAAPAGSRSDLRPSNKRLGFSVIRHVHSPCRSLSPYFCPSAAAQEPRPGWEASGLSPGRPSAAVCRVGAQGARCGTSSREPGYWDFLWSRRWDRGRRARRCPQPGRVCCGGWGPRASFPGRLPPTPSLAPTALSLMWGLPPPF